MAASGCLSSPASAGCRSGWSTGARRRCASSTSSCPGRRGGRARLGAPAGQVGLGAGRHALPRDGAARAGCSSPAPATTRRAAPQGHRSAGRISAELGRRGRPRPSPQPGSSVVRPGGAADRRAARAGRRRRGRRRAASGSALHLSAFAPASARVLEIGDSRSPDRPRRRCSWSSTPRAGTSTRSCRGDLALRRPAGRADRGCCRVTADRIGRAQVMRRLLAHYEQPRYLEIGVCEGGTFDRVAGGGAGRRRPGVPLRPHGARASGARAPSYHQVTSDEYFGTVVEPDAPFDVIYLDGLHTVGADPAGPAQRAAAPPAAGGARDRRRPPAHRARRDPRPAGVLRRARARRAGTTRRRGWATSSGSSTSSRPSASSCRSGSSPTTTARPSSGGTVGAEVPAARAGRGRRDDLRAT